MARVASVEPPVLGLRAQASAGDQLLVNNLTRGPVVILGRDGRPLVRVPPGETRSWHDGRVVHPGDPPPPVAGAPASDPRIVKNWEIPGRAAGRGFVIRGWIGWVPPAKSEGGAPVALLAGSAIVLAACTVIAAYLLGRRRT